MFEKTKNLITVIGIGISFIINAIVYEIKMLKHRPRLSWNKSHIREDEFHSSLDFDSSSCMDMNKEDRKQYMTDLVCRRNIAHNRDLEK